MNAPFRIPKPIEIDPRSCELCGRTIDEHECLDHGEGPEFFCWDDDDIVKCWEVADPRDAWRHTGEKPPPTSVRNSDIGTKPTTTARSYRTPQATIDAFWFVIRLDDPEYLKRWFARHPLDVPALVKLYERKNAA
jgi:hypothetical protein